MLEFSEVVPGYKYTQTRVVFICTHLYPANLLVTLYIYLSIFQCTQPSQPDNPMTTTFQHIHYTVRIIIPVPLIVDNYYQRSKAVLKIAPDHGGISIINIF